MYLHFFWLGCVRPDVYGSNCNKLCTDNCREPRCNISNGACFSCGPGWIGDFCKTSKKKVKSRSHELCGLICFFMYIKSYILLLCVECESGFYGFSCVLPCGGYCKDNKPCNHINGTCSNGCLDGWIGVNCNKRKK